MKDLRLISFLPSATEMACALGLEEQLVGVTHECDYPAKVRGKPVVVRCALPVERMSLREIDQSVTEYIRQGRNLYEVDEELLEQLAPTHILTQALCQVCAPSGNEITRVLKSLPTQPEIVWLSPHSIEDIYKNLRELGQKTGKVELAERLIVDCQKRLKRLTALTSQATHRPRVLCLEWIEPCYCCGHWVPELVECAGGEDGLGRKLADSVRITWGEIAAWSPEVLVVMPCGFTTDAAAVQAGELLRQPGWSELPAVRDGRVYAVNANAYFARPGPRVVEGAELLAHLFHPQLCEWRGPSEAFRPVRIETIQPLGSRSKRCAECGAVFSCGPEPGKERCWCDDLPPLDPRANPTRDCLCPRCLAKAIEAKGK